MNIKSLIICFCTIIALASCDTNQPLQSSPNISVVSQSMPAIETDTGLVVVDLSNSVSASSEVTPVYTWDLGDGSPPFNTISPALTHQFEKDGTYNVLLTVSDANAVAPSKTVVVTVVYQTVEDSQITVQSATMPTIQTATGSVSMDMTQSISLTSDVDAVFTWNVGDGSASFTTARAELTHQFDQGGTYNVSLTISDANAVASPKTILVSVVYTPVDVIVPLSANITMSRDLLNVSFMANVTGGEAPYSYAWSFGDSQTGTGANPVHAYATVGTYPVSLIVTDSKFTQVNVPAQDVIITTTANKAPIVTISNVSKDYLNVDVSAVGSQDPEGANLTYTWEFGDGTVYQNAGILQAHEYDFAGTYIITLTVSDGEAQSMATESVTVMANPADKPAYYTLFETAFFDFLSGPCANCHYNNGMSRFSMGATQDSISLVTAQAGLIALLENPDGFDKVIDNPIDGKNNHLLTIDGDNEATWRALMDQMQTYIAITNNVAPVAMMNTPVVSGLSVMVDGSSSTDANGDALNYSWSFDGQAQTGVTASYTYATAGDKTITLSVTDGKGGSHTTSTMLTLIKPNSAPIALFDYTTDTLTASFDAKDSSDEDNDSFTYAWDFGDGMTQVASNSATAVHTYSSEGTFDVSLTVADAFGANTLTQKVTVANAINHDPVASFDFTVDNLLVTLASTSTDQDNDNLTYQWVIDEQVVATESLTSNLFTSSGDKVVTLNVRDERGATDSITQTISIANQAPTASFSVVKAFTMVTFDASTSIDPENDALTYAWNFGDNQTGSGMSQTHTYSSPGTYSVSLTVDDGQNQNSVTREITVEGPTNTAPRALFTYENTDNAFNFDASTSIDAENDPLTYQWSFGDGATDMGAQVNHTFTGEADFTVTLTVSDGDLSGVKSIKVSTIPKLTGNPSTGEQLYNQQCFSCHQENGIGINGEYEPIAINRYLDGLGDLYDKIDTTMPPTDSNACTGQCAADIEAYMLLWERVTSVYSCPVEKEDAIKYGPRQLRLFTVQEYANTVRDLVGVEVDQSKLIGNALIHEFDNNTKTQIDFNRFKAFEAMASSIADQAASTNFTTVLGAGNCATSNGCADVFVDYIAKQGFRRPLTDSEKTAYRLAFDNADAGTGGDHIEGMRLALRTLLMSPNFLYRSEVGMNKADYETYMLDAPTQYEQTSTPDVRHMSDFGQYYPGNPKADTEFTSGIDWQMWYEFTGKTLIKVVWSGTTPSAKITIGSDVIFEGVPPQFLTTMYFLVEGYTGQQTIHFSSGQQNGASVIMEEMAFSQGQVRELEVPNISDDAFVLTPYELATYLAYTYTGTMPDQSLMSAADDGLYSDEAVQAQIDRLLATDHAKTHFGEFAAQWLTTDEVLLAEKDEALFPTYTSQVREAMTQEVREIFNDVLFDDSVPFTNLYDSNYTFVNQVLADFYGIGGVTGDEFVKATAPGRGGIVTSGAFLSAWTSPAETKLILRGVRLRERFLCQHLPPFPSNVDLTEVRNAQQAEVDRISALNNGQIRQSHLDYINTDVDACKSCHEYIINPLGVGLEDFDAAGLPRTHYANGLEVDFTGFEPQKENHHSMLYGIDDVFDYSQARQFSGAENLGEILATEDVTRACMVEMSFRYMMGTGPDEFDHANKEAIVMTDDEREDYTCTTDEMLNQMSANSDNPKAALSAFGLSDIVRYRKTRNR